MSRAESPLRTLAVAAGVALVCSLIVSVAVQIFRPYQLAYDSLERNRVVLQAAALIEADETTTDRDVVARYLDLDVRIVDLATASLADDVDASTYDFEAALGDPQMTLPIPPDEDTARIGATPRYMPVYFAEGGQRIVLPFYGRGMWSTITGFLCLERDYETIAALEIYSQAETPGIGDRIENRQWLDKWRGKKLHDSTGALALRIGAAGSAAEAEHRVDGITGATVTVSSLERSLLFWLGPRGFGPLLRNLRNQE